jgi:hypothetical protein
MTTNLTIDVAPVNQQEELPPTPFRLWVNEEIAAANPDLPLKTLLTPTLGRRFRKDAESELEFVPIGGLSFPVVNGTSGAEDIFADWLNTKINNNSALVNTLVVGLCRSLRVYDEELWNEEQRLLLERIANAPQIAPAHQLPALTAGKELAEVDQPVDDGAAIDGVLPETTAEAPECVSAVPVYNKLSVAKSRELVYDILNGQADEKYSLFAENNNEVCQQIIKIAGNSTNEKTQNLLRITFMISHRVDPEWSLADSLQLISTENKAILDFWAKEANGGVEPAPEPAEPEPKDPDKAEDDAKKKEGEDLADMAGKEAAASPG